MAAVVFDTLILSRKLAAAGMATEQAQGVAAAIAETLGEQIATQRDVADVRRDLESVRRDLTTRIDQVETKLSTRIDQVEAKLSARIDLMDAGFRAELRQSEQRQTIRLGLMLAGGLAVVATLLKLL
jgi:septal ring factor EnvC (AmiA/AmiB activator)